MIIEYDYLRDPQSDDARISQRQTKVLPLSQSLHLISRSKQSQRERERDKPVQMGIFRPLVLQKLLNADTLHLPSLSFLNF